MKTYRQVPVVFRKDGFNFQQLARQGRVALYAKTKPDLSQWYFEVVVLVERDPEMFMGKKLPAREVYPSSEAWGTYGWTPFDYDDAWKRFENKCARFSPNQVRMVLETVETYRSKITPEATMARESCSEPHFTRQNASGVLSCLPELPTPQIAV